MDLTQPYELIMFVITILTLSLQIGVMYLIVFVSPQYMSDYRIFLLISTIFEFSYTFIWGIMLSVDVPVFYPGIGLLIRGLSAKFGQSGIVSFFQIFTGTGMILSQDICLVYRFLSVQSRNRFREKILKPRITILIYVCVCIAGAMTGLNYCYCMATPEEYHEIFRHWTNMTIDLTLPRQVLRNTEPATQNFLRFTAVGLLVSEVVYFILIVWILLILRRNRASFSKRTIELHQRLTLLLFAQVFFPTLMLCWPYVGMVVRISSKPFNNHDRAQLWILVFTAHPAVVSSLVVLFVTPYRNHVFEFFRRAKSMFHPVNGFSSQTIISTL
ncbi:hypothetical protein M3Y96_01222000 [Aphelenchoides besseyi]|nr:hypothetical protein M3Y96_01222000 [Aphelenchoides besseyi]